MKVLSYEDFPFEGVSENLEDDFDDSGFGGESDFEDDVSVDLDDEDFEEVEV